ncbi:SubName: Full=Uncharacterized protein {ECO:0000313/EMBL:CCA71574.1} [Serendipita indica DSM 11827]|nr:SubName: Full=Uncharacterized protein {ECO:0000313/EMBL:CCA71574.1} [Serendipita indica DSM 11827]
MTTIYEKRLVIKSSELGKAGTLLLAFKPLDNTGIRQKIVVWKIIPFSKAPNNVAKVKYVSQLAFIAPQIDDDNIITPSSHTVDVGGAVIYDIDSDKNIIIKDTEENKEERLYRRNEQHWKLLDIALGLQIDAKADPEPILHFPNIAYISGSGHELD